MGDIYVESLKNDDLSMYNELLTFLQTFETWP